MDVGRDIDADSAVIPIPDRARVLRGLDRPDLNGAAPFRVGVVVDGAGPSRWVQSFVTFLSTLPGLVVHPVLLGAGSPAEARGPSWLMDRLYSASRRRFDPFGEADQSTDHGVRYAGWTRADTIAPVAALRCGVVVWLGAARDPELQLTGLGAHGVLTLRLGRCSRAVPYWDEVATGQPTSVMSVVWHDSSLSRGRVIRAAETSTVQGLYFTENAAEPLLAAMYVLANLCLKFRREGSHYEEAIRQFPEEQIDHVPVLRYPSSLDAARFTVRKLSRSVALRARTHGKVPRWFTAVRLNTGGSIVDAGRDGLSGFREVPLPPGSEAMADPFPVEMGGRTWILVEDVPNGARRARLGCVGLSESGSCSDLVVILEQDYHLSYPCVVPAGGELFLLPETGEARRVDLYRFARFPTRVELVSTLLEGLQMVDTTPVFVNGRWYFFATTMEPFHETLLFSSSRLHGPWTLHPASPVSASVRNCRSAGHLFWRSGRLYRPAQDCSQCYGYAITVNEVTKLTPTEFEEHAVARVLPSWMPGLLGTHTWNESSRVQVIDGVRLRASGPSSRRVAHRRMG